MTDKPPSAWLVQKALAVWREAQGGTDDQQLAEILGTETDDITEVLARIVRGAIDRGNMAAMCAQSRASMKIREDRFLAQEERLRTMATELMGVLGCKTIEQPEFTLTLKAGKGGLVLTDEDAVPDEYKIAKTTYKIDMKAVAADMEQGVVVPGVEQRNGAPYITIRTK